MCVIQDIREYTNCIKKIMFIHLYLVTPLYYSIYAYVCSFNSTQKTKDELKKQSFIHFRTLILLQKMHPSRKIHKSNTCPQTSLQLDLKPRTLHCEQAINKNKIFPLCLISPHLNKMYSCSDQTLINTPFIL